MDGRSPHPAQEPSPEPSRDGHGGDVVHPAALRVLWVLLALCLAAGAALFLVVAVRTLFYPHEVIVSEAAVGLAVQSIRDGVPLYAPVRWTAEPFVIVHYTPLYYLTTALVATISGAADPRELYFPGRLVSILGTIATALVAALVVRRATGRNGPALAAGALWLSFYQVVFWGTTQRVDAMGILFEALGVLAFVRARGRGGVGAVVTAAGWRGAGELAAVPWFVAAWATKQVMIAGLLAVIASLFVQGGVKRAARFAVCGFGAIFVIAGALTAWSRGGFWTATVLGTVSAHADTPWVVFSNAELFFGSPWNIVMLAAATWAAWVGAGGVPAWRRRGTTPVGAMVGGSGTPGSGTPASGTPGTQGVAREFEPPRASPSSGPGGARSAAPPTRSGGAGSEGTAASLWLFLGLYLWIGLLLAIATDANLPRFFPPMLAMALLVALLLDRARCAPRLAAGLLVILVLAGASHGLYEMRSLVRERVLNLHEGNQRLLFARALEQQTAPGARVLAQDAGMVLSARRTAVVADPYVFSILAGNDAWRPDVLEHGIREHRYGAVVLNRRLESLDPAEWTTLWIYPAKSALLENYRLVDTIVIDQEWRFLEPRRFIYVPREGE